MNVVYKESLVPDVSKFYQIWVFAGMKNSIIGSGFPTDITKIKVFAVGYDDQPA